MKTLQQIINTKSLLAILFAITISTNAALAIGENPTTNSATGVTSVDATMNATNGVGAADNESFWVSLSGPIDTSIPVMPVGVYSTPVLPGVAAGANFSTPLSIVTTAGIPGNMPAITPGTTYYYVAWASVGGTWYPGATQSVTIPSLSQTISFTQPTDVVYGDADFIVTATSDSALPVTVTSATPLVCSVSGFTVHTESAGTCTLNANQAGNGTYGAAAQVSKTFNIAKKDITIASGDFASTSKVYDGNTIALLNAATGVVFSGLVGVDVVAIDATNATGTLASKDVSPGTVVTFAGYVLGGANAANYNLVGQPANETQAVTAKSLTASGLSVANKVYDSNTSAVGSGVPVLVGVLGADIGNVIIGGSIIMNFSDPFAGNSKVVNVTGLTLFGTSSLNYSLTQPTLSADITKKSLTVSGISIANKVYDGLTTAVINGVAALNGVINTDIFNVTLGGSPVATFDTKYASTTKPVAITGYSVSGSAIGNYDLVAPTSTADITKKTLTVTATGINKVYDATNTATVTFADDKLVGDDITITGTATFANKNWGNGKTVTVTDLVVTGSDAVNYTLASSTIYTSANITKKDILVTATADNKVYDSNRNAVAHLTSADVVPGDIVNFAYTNARFGTRFVGNNKFVTVTGITKSGADAANYTITNILSTAIAQANITPRPLSVTTTAVNKVYDATTTAAISSITSNVLPGDTIGILGSASANFSDKNVDNGKVVTVNLVITPAVDNVNYSIPSTATTTANITVRTLNILSATGTDKVYDGSRNGLATFSDDRLAGDVFTYASTTSRFGNKNVGDHKHITVNGISITGTDANNYHLAQTTFTTPSDVSITPKSATITADNQTKVYGTADPIFTATAVGLVSPDVLTGSLSRVAGENVGTYDITAGTITAGTNYVTTFATGTLTITKADQTITISPVADKNPEDAAFDVTATTTSGLPITFALGMGPNVCTLATSTITLTGSLGVCNIVADQAGDTNYNSATASITINVVDTHAPVITLNGDAVVNLFVGNAYNELGATAVDFVNGTSSATVSGDIVNTNLAGTYTVRYNATDTAGNIAIEKTRSVVVTNNGGIIFTSGGGSGGSFGGLIPTNSSTGGSNNGGLVLGAAKFKFTKNLSFGMKKNNDVKELQKALAALGLYKASTTGDFDKATLEAVKAYQKANNIKPVSGYFGPLTRAVINK